MKKLKKLFYLFIIFIINLELVFAVNTDPAGGIFGNSVTKDNVRTGNIHIDDIPKILRATIDLLLGFAGTIAIIFIIVGGYKILFGSLTSEKTKGKETIIMALSGFAISSLAWFIIKFIIDNFSGNV